MKALPLLLPVCGLIGPSPLLAQTPEYTIEILGPGTVINDMNEAGETVGWTIATRAGVQAFVAGPNHAFETLPLPEGYASAWAQGINDAGVVVGSVAVGGFPEFGEAMAWYPDGLGGYTMQFLGQLPGHTQSVAYDVNNRGDIIGSSITPGFQGGPTVWFNSPSGVLHLGLLGAPSSPKQINDQGVIVGIAGGLFDVDTLQATPLPPLPAGWSGFQGWAINDNGELAGTGIHGSLRSAAIWTAAGGWESISSRFSFSASVQAFDINDSGAATAEVPQPAVHLAGTPGSRTLASLLEPAQQSQWSFPVSLGNAINDAGQIAAIAVNTSTNQAGVVLLTPKTCQTNLGFQGPGTASATLCGEGLNVGESSDHVIVGAPGFASGALLVSLAGFANAPVLGGTLVSIGGFAVQLPVVADEVGEARLTLTGFAPPVPDLIFQSFVLDASLPQGVAFTNALLVKYGQ